MAARLSPRSALALSAILLLAAAALFAWLVSRVERDAWAAVETRLRTEVHLIEDGLGADLETGERDELRARTIALGKRAGIRITLIRDDGTVLADSEANPDAMDNLAQRPEVVEALTHEFGACHRFSPTLKVDSIFIARAIRRGNLFIGWIRASITDAAVEKVIGPLEWILALASGIGAAAALACAWIARKTWVR